MARKSLHFFINKFSYKTLLSVLFILLIAVVVLARFIFPNQKVSAAWWNEGWGYRVAVSIGNTGGSNLTDFQVPLSIGTSALINAGKMKSDCSDIRITDINGKLLTYWLSGCNTTSTQVWPKIPTIPTSGTTVYVYYGNSSATSGKTKVGTAEYPGLSCKSILTAGDSSGDNNYWVDPSNGNSSDKFQAFCDMTNDAGGWMLATQSMINTEIGVSVTTTKTTGTNNGLTISNITTASGCGPSSSYKVLLNDTIPWTQIRADYQFTGGNSCWGIFGNTGYGGDANLITYSSATDTIRNQVKMGGSNGDSFDGVTGRCDNYTYNFWHSNQGVGTTRSAQVVLRRNNTALPAGLGTGIGCIAGGNYGWKYQNIYIRENLMTFSATAGSPATEELSPAPIAYWKFDEGNGGTAFDSSFNKNNGTISNATWANEDQCISGKCLLFNNAVNSNVNINLKYDNNQYFTISTFIKPTSTNSFEIIAGTYVGNNINSGLILTNNNLCFHDYSTFSADRSICSSNNPIQLNQWQHVTLVYNNGSVGLFVNGKNVGNGSYTIISSGATAIIGGPISNSAGRAFNGFIDDVKIYPYARTTAQIKQDYAAGLAHSSTSKGTSASLGSNNKNGDFLSNGLIGYWKMDENIGTTTLDSSGNNNTGTFVGTSAPAWTNGKFGIGTSLNSINSYIDAGANSSINLTGSNLTFSGWVKFTTCTSANTFLVKNNQYWLAFYPSGANCQATYADSSNWSFGNFGYYGAITTGVWHYITLTKDPNYLVTIYVDGSPIISKKFGGAITTQTSNLNIGGNSTNYGLNGLIDEVRIYNRALSPSEVSSLYNWAPGPVGYWNFDEKTGTIANDKSGNNLNGTFGTGNSSPSWSTGKYGSGLNFATSGMYVKVPLGSQASNFNTNYSGRSFSYSLWFKSNNISGPNQHLITNNEPCNNPGNFAISLSGGTLYYNYYSSVGAAQVTQSFTPTPALQNNQWYHLEWTKTFGQLGVKAYLNGLPQTISGDSLLNGYGNVNNIVLGAWNGTGFTCSTGVDNVPPIAANSIIGSIDDIKIYNYIRSQKQVTEDMNGGHPAGGSPVGSQLGYWKFDEGFGTTTNNSGNQGSVLNAVFGTGNSAPTWTNDGKFSKALNFNANQYIYYNPYFLENTKEVTISAWVKPISDTYIFQYGSSGSYNGYINNFRVNSNGSMTIDLEYLETGHFTPSTNPNVVPLNTWSYVSVSVGTNYVKFYVNGVLITTSSYFSGMYPLHNANISYNNIGRYYYNSTTFSYSSGFIDEVKVYNSALTDDEIKIDYNRGASLQMGQSTQTIGATTTSLDYCIPGDTTPCTSPIAEYKFDEKTGTSANDTSGSANSANLENSPSWTFGKIGSAIQLNGTNQRGNAGTNLNPSLITTEAWVYRTSAAVNQGIIRKQSSYAISLNNNTIQVAPGNNWSFYDTAQTIPMNTWTHLAWTYDGLNMKLYKNGSWVWTSASLVGTFPSNGSTTWIGFDDNNWWWGGKLDQVRIFNYARTPAQIAYDYNRGYPVGWWKFDECQGNTAKDSSGFGKTGAISIGASGTQTALGTCSDGLSTSAWNNGKTGKYNSGLSFDGNDDYMSAPIPVSGTEATIAFWAKNISSGLGPYLFRSDANTRTYVNISGNNISVVKGNPAVTLNSTSVITTNWNHVVVKWWTSLGTTYGQTYINGQAIGVGTSFVDSSPGSYITVAGFSPTGTQNAAGQFDDVRVYNYALTSTQIKTLYNNGAVNFSN